MIGTEVSHEGFSINGHEILLYVNEATLSAVIVSSTITTYVKLISTTFVPVHDFAGVKSSVLKIHRTT